MIYIPQVMAIINFQGEINAVNKAGFTTYFTHPVN